MKPFVRDKDAIQALVLIAEVAAFYKKQGKTLYDGLQDIFAEYGYYEEKTISVTLSGLEGPSKIKAIMAKFRNEAPKTLGNVPVVQTEDFKELTCVNVDGTVTKMTTPPSDVLKYQMADESWVAVRPSGTEPKIKFYIGVKGANQKAADDRVAELEAAINEITAE